MNKYLDISEIEALQIEPTSKCNLACPQCARTYKGKTNPELPLVELTPKDYNCIFTEELMPQLRYVTFNGNYGDPMASRYITYAIDKLLKNNIAVRIFTNGSLRNPSWWRRLGKQLSQTSSKVIFSIDGLEDTNAIYRVNSNFKKILENARAYIQEGGKARWDFLIFKHNHHQVESAKVFAKKMGFQQFQEKSTARFISGDYGSHLAQKNSRKIFNKKGDSIGTLRDVSRTEETFRKVLKKYGTWNNYTNTTSIHCKYKKDMKALFIDFEAFVWPCCWVGAPAYFMRLEDNPQKKQFDMLRKKYGTSFNSLRCHSLQEILSHQWFESELVQSWKNKITDQNPKLMTCSRTCGTDYEFTSGTGYKNSTMFNFNNGEKSC